MSVTNTTPTRITHMRIKVIALAISMALIVGLAGYHVRQRPDPIEQPAAATQKVPPAAETSIIQNGPYKGWTRYHNDEMRFTINASPVVKIDDYVGYSQSDPPYTKFAMDLYSDDTGRTIELLHLAIFNTELSYSVSNQDNFRSDIYTVAPTKQDVTVAGHKAVFYYYDGDIRTALYLIDDGGRTIAVSGFIHTKDPESVENYWTGFDNTVNSLEIDPPSAPR